MTLFMLAVAAAVTAAVLYRFVRGRRSTECGVTKLKHDLIILGGGLLLIPVFLFLNTPQSYLLSNEMGALVAVFSGSIAIAILLLPLGIHFMHVETRFSTHKD